MSWSFKNISTTNPYSGQTVQTFTTNLYHNGSKPKLYFVGNEQYDPILMAFETPMGPYDNQTYLDQNTTGGRKSIAIFQYDNLIMMQTNQTSAFITFHERFPPRRAVLLGSLWNGMVIFDNPNSNCCLNIRTCQVIRTNLQEGPISIWEDHQVPQMALITYGRLSDWTGSHKYGLISTTK